MRVAQRLAHYLVTFCEFIVAQGSTSLVQRRGPRRVMWTEGESHGQPQYFAVAIGLFVMPLLFSVAPVHAIAGAVSMLASFALYFGGSSRNNPLGIVGIRH